MRVSVEVQSDSIHNGNPKWRKEHDVVLTHDFQLPNPPGGIVFCTELGLTSVKVTIDIPNSKPQVRVQENLDRVDQTVLATAFTVIQIDAGDLFPQGTPVVRQEHLIRVTRIT